MSADRPLVPLHRNRDFILLWSGQAVSTLGTNISRTAVPLLTLALTGSPAATGFVVFGGLLPSALLYLPAGVIVDRVDRKKLMIIADTMRALTLAVVVIGLWQQWLTLPMLFVASFIENSCDVFFGLADTGAIRNVVPSEQMVEAMSRTEARVHVARLAGRPLGGFLFGISHIAPFLFDAVSYGCSVITLLFVRGRFNQERVGERRHPVDEVKEGIGWLLKQRFLLTTYVLIGGTNFVFAGLILSVIVALEGRGTPPPLIGLVMAGFGVGGLIGSVIGPWLQQRLPGRAVVVGALWGWTILTPVLVIPSAWSTGATFVVMAVIGTVWNVILISYALRITPDELLGRTEAAGTLFTISLSAFSPLVTGFLLERSDPAETILLLGSILLVLAIAATFNRTLRNAPDLTEIAQA